MRPSALYRPPFSLALGSLFCGVAATRDVGGVEGGELMMTSPGPHVEPAPEPSCGNVGNSYTGMDGATPICSCMFGEMAVDYFGVPCFDELALVWPPDFVPRRARECSCKPSTCITRVYGAILLQPLDLDQARFPNALPGLFKEDIQCLVDSDEAYIAMREYGGDDVRETNMWTVRDGTNVMLAIRDIEFTVDSDVWTMGDIHGRLGSFRKVHQDWMQANQEPYVVGLGDMIDRGNRQLEVFTGMVAWRAVHPNKVSFVRGNHETKVIAQEYGFECIDTFGRAPYSLPSGSKDTDKLFPRFLRFFDLIPAALRIKQPTANANAVFMHGGFGPEVLKKLYADSYLIQGELAGGSRVLDEFLWSEMGERCTDPGWRCPEFNARTDVIPSPLRAGVKLTFPYAGANAIDNSLFKKSARGAGFYRTRTAMRMFMTRMQSCMLITGHTHESTIQLITPDPTDLNRCTVQQDGVDRVGYTQATILSAQQFYRHSKVVPLEDELQIGMLGILSVRPVVQYQNRPVFPAGTYDDVSQTLDVGVSGGSYPVMSTGCIYLEVDGDAYKCAFPDQCPEADAY